MKVSELISNLSLFPQDAEIVVLCGTGKVKPNYIDVAPEGNTVSISESYGKADYTKEIIANAWKTYKTR